MHAKKYKFFSTQARDTTPEFGGHGKVVFDIAFEFSHCDERFSEIQRKRLNRPGRRQPALAWNDDKVDFAYASGGEGPVLQSLSALRLNASSSTNQAMHDFVAKLALLGRMLGSVWNANCPYLSRIITGSASKAEKVPNFTKSTFPKKSGSKFSKNYISGITKASAFAWHASLVLSPPIPSNEPCSAIIMESTR